MIHEICQGSISVAALHNPCEAHESGTKQVKIYVSRYILESYWSPQKDSEEKDQSDSQTNGESSDGDDGLLGACLHY